MRVFHFAILAVVVALAVPCAGAAPSGGLALTPPMGWNS
jgi:hypothetical protein